MPLLADLGKAKEENPRAKAREKEDGARKVEKEKVKG